MGLNGKIRIHLTFALSVANALIITSQYGRLLFCEYHISFFMVNRYQPFEMKRKEKSICMCAYIFYYYRIKTVHILLHTLSYSKSEFDEASKLTYLWF